LHSKRNQEGDETRGDDPSAIQRLPGLRHKQVAPVTEGYSREVLDIKRFPMISRKIGNRPMGVSGKTRSGRNLCRGLSTATIGRA
jgi:hypothetical protein